MNVLDFSLGIKDWLSDVFSINSIDHLRLDPIYGGGNNRSYLVTMENNHYFLKQYYQDQLDIRNRLKSEFSFSLYAWNQGLRCIAEPISFDESQSVAIYEYIQGRKLTYPEIQQNEINKALDFIIHLNEDRNNTHAKKLPIASEACFSLVDHIELIDRRIEKLMHVRVMDDIDEDVNQFVKFELIDQWDSLKNTIFAQLPTKELNYQIKQLEERILSPSDFGFHNALIDKNKDIKFFDFEYAGWDDPAKLVCDFFCQPAVPINKNYFEQFANQIANITNNSWLSMDRIQLLLPVTQMKWCCIVLNCFIQDFKPRKQFSFRITNEYRVGQFLKAKTFLNSIKI